MKEADTSRTIRLFPLNMLDPVRKCFGYGQLWPACSQNRAGSYKPDPISGIWFVSVFPKKAWTILCKKDPDPIWMAWTGFGQKKSGPEASWCARVVGPGFWQNVTRCCKFTSSPTFRLGYLLTQMAWIVLCKTRPDPIWLWPTVSDFG